MNTPTDIETRLRASLADHAGQAPPGRPLAERILTELDAPVLRPRFGWRTWTFPLLAAAAIAAVALTVAGVSGIHHSAAPIRPETHRASPTPSAVVSNGLKPTPSPTATAAPAVGFAAADVTFVGTSNAWALGRQKCGGHAGTCTVVLRTIDGGAHWTAVRGATFNLPGVRGCDRGCVEHLRFASASDGYAYGPHALFMTTDGGAHWARQPGLGADALETLDGNVILARVINSCAGCPQFARAPIGTASWTPFSLPGFPASALRIDLARAGHSVILAPISYNPAKPAGDGPVVYRSSNDGATWHQTTRACPDIGIGYTEYVTAATMASDTTMAVACASTTKTNLTGYGSTTHSDNGGQTFSAPPNGGKQLPADIIASPSAHVQLIVVNGSVYRSIDTGDSWTNVPDLRGVTFLGFESTSLGHAVGDGGRTIWTTHNGGATWTSGAFSP